MSLVLNVEILGEFKKLTQATKGAENSLSKLSKTTKSISNSMKGALAAVGVGFTLNSVINGVKEAVNAASDLQQQFGAVDSVFKELSPSLKEFATSLAPIGLSSAEASQNIALLGAQLKGYGLPVDEAASRTKELTLLAADLAATFGGTTSDAVRSIGSLFRGEFDPIEKYGVAIKKSDVNARLAAEGLAGLEGEALKQAEAQAALALLFEKTADAQGQAARESNSYASQSAYLNAEFENMKAEVGQALLPILVELFQEIRDNIPQIKEFVAGFIEVVKSVSAATLEIIRHKDQILPLVTIVGSLTLGFKGINVALGAYKTITGASTVATAALGASMTKALGAIGLVIAALETVKWLNEQIYAQGGFERVAGTPGGNFSGQSDLTAPNPSSFGNMAPSVPKAPKVAVPKTVKAPTPNKKSTPTTVNNNVNVTVKKSTATGKDIATAINRTIKAAGTNVIKAI